MIRPLQARPRNPYNISKDVPLAAFVRNPRPQILGSIYSGSSDGRGSGVEAAGVWSEGGQVDRASAPWFTADLRERMRAGATAVGIDGVGAGSSGTGAPLLTG